MNKGLIKRWKTREVPVGDVYVGAKNAIRVQSMTTTDTKDVDATVAQTIALAEAGCEIVRITAPSVRAAEALKDIRSKLDKAGFNIPLVADIHFLPQAAMEAVEHVEKVRINPGNYADRKKVQIRSTQTLSMMKNCIAFTKVLAPSSDVPRHLEDLSE